MFYVILVVYFLMASSSAFIDGSIVQNVWSLRKLLLQLDVIDKLELIQLRLRFQKRELWARRGWWIFVHLGPDRPLQQVNLPW